MLCFNTLLRHGGACLQSEHWRDRERTVSDAYWASSLAFLVSPRSSLKEPVSKSNMGGSWEMTLRVISGFHQSTQACMHTQRELSLVCWKLVWKPIISLWPSEALQSPPTILPADRLTGLFYCLISKGHWVLTREGQSSPGTWKRERPGLSQGETLS